MTKKAEHTAQEIAESLNRTANAGPGLLARLGLWFDDGRVMRTAFAAMLAGVSGILYLDYRELADVQANAPIEPGMVNPILPPVIRELPQTVSRPVPPGEDGNDLDNPVVSPFRPDIRTPADSLRTPLEIRLGSNGTLHLTGTIHPGASELFHEKMAEVAEYVKQVELVSPGGSVFDALTIGKTIRHEGFKTIVRKGALCASSCPLVFAGGAERIAEDGAAIGVHQVYTPLETGESASQAIATTQAVTADITRHLMEMDVDPALWTHALETPPQKLYYLTQEEIVKYRLSTDSENGDVASQ